MSQTPTEDAHAAKHARREDRAPRPRTSGHRDRWHARSAQAPEDPCAEPPARPKQAPSSRHEVDREEGHEREARVRVEGQERPSPDAEDPAGGGPGHAAGDGEQA